MRLLAPVVTFVLVAAHLCAAQTLLFTADTEGHTAPCAECPVHVGLGGLARRGTLLRANRPAPEDTLLLDAGNFLFGAESADSRGKVIADAYHALGYDAVNLSFRELRYGKAHALDLLKEAGLQVVCANLLDDATGKPLANPYVVKKAAGRRVAVLGLTDPPAGWQRLPQLKEQLAGVRVVPAADALAEWLPKAKADSDAVVVLYYGHRSGLARVVAKAGTDVIAIGMGGITGESPDGPPTTAAPEMHGKSVARIAIANGVAGKVEQLSVSPDLAPDPAMEKIVLAYAAKPSPAVVVAASQPATSPAAVAMAEQRNPGMATPEPRAIEPRSPEPPATQRVQARAPSSMPAVALPPPTSVVEKPPTSSPALRRVRAHQDLQPKGLAGVGLKPEDVNGAIERGRDFLWEHLRAQLVAERRKLGEEMGYDVLQALALVHAGAQLKYPEFDAALRDYLARLDPSQRSMQTYAAGVACMLIVDYGDPVFFPKLRMLTRSLVEQQLPDGSWDYGFDLPPGSFPDPRDGPALSVEGGIPIDPQAKPEPFTRKTEWPKRPPGDNSTTQFAILGLRAAARVRAGFDADLWRRNLNGFRARRCADGSWAYSNESAGYGSMTCAGVCAIAIDRFELGEKDPADDADLESGLAWLEDRFSVSTNPGHGNYLYYYLYSLERTGRILDTEFIGKHEWYPLGASFLVTSQQKDGSWLEPGDSNPTGSTSFALLFLTRATQTLKPELKRGGQGTLATAVATPPPARLYFILDASGSMIEEMDGKPKFDAARDALADMLAMLPDSAQVAIRVYGHRNRAIEPGANEDTALEYPMGPVDRPKLATLLKSLRARGKTPLALSLTQAAQDLASVSGQPVTVVLLTDGGEDTFPRRDPVKAAAELAKVKGLTFHVVGFDVNSNPDWTRQLKAMADQPGGHYWAAARSNVLLRNLRSAVFGIPDDFTLYDASARPVGQGKFGESKTLPEGKYRFKTTYAGQPFDADLWVNTGMSTSVIFDADKFFRQATTQPAPTTRPAGGR